MKISPEIISEILNQDTSSDVFEHWIILKSEEGNKTSTAEFMSAAVSYYPGPGYPSHFIVRTKDSIHIFNYYSIECAYRPKHDCR